MTNDRQDRTVSPGKGVHWFNPENDLALATGLSNYTPPRAGCVVRQAGEALPLWYGEEGDLVICSPERQWLEKVTSDFGLTTKVYGENHPNTSLRPRPWGWSAYTRRQFQAMGFNDSTLPTLEMVEKKRQLSHRRTASMLAQRLKEMLPDIKLADAAMECHTPDDVMEFLKKYPDAYLKSPWSSSGRGVIATGGRTKERIIKFAADSIRLQGSVMAERAYDKIMDFAMLFECSKGTTRAAGTSIFLTDSGGTYMGNLLAPEAKRLSTVERNISGDILVRVRESLITLINEHIAPYYQGVFGVDMLVSSDGTLDATVELNLRTTMGYVANRFADTFMHPDACGVMRSGPIKCAPTEIPDYATEGGKLTGGTLLLSPPCGKFSFSAEITSPR